MDRKPLPAQMKWNPDTGQVHMVGSKASDKPVREQQASLLQWSEDKARLERWESQSEGDV